ncbi:unnamed protein product, partial [Staurois parvus]
LLCGYPPLRSLIYIYIYIYFFFFFFFSIVILGHVGYTCIMSLYCIQGRTDHLETRALPEGPGCPWYLFHRLF